MRKVMSGILAALLLLSVGALSFVPVTRANEFVIWCWDDPVVSLNGQVFNIQIGVLAMPSEVRRGVQVADTTLLVPRGVEASVISITNQYFRETVQIITVPDGRTVGVIVKFQATAILPAALAVNGALRDSGTTSGMMHTTITVR